MNSGDLKNEVVVSGISGRFPESNGMEEFKKQLFDGADLVTDDPKRWPSGMHGLPARFGKIKDLQHFDSEFFGIPPKQADTMDPQLRILLEVTHEAIADSGTNPVDIRGSKTGVFIAASSSDAFDFWNASPERVNGYGLTGCCIAMFANRLSYTFDLTGPSFAIDSGCSSSLIALQQALSALKNGECDGAIVGGVNLILNPTYSLHHQKMGMLSQDGKCKVFDASGDGYVRSDAVVAVYLQKSSVAKRIYATLLGAKTNNDGHKETGITFPSAITQGKLLVELYEEIGVDPKEVSYIEAHGTGTKVGDPQEVAAIAEFFCKNRRDPLLIGSVKSNMGHSEPVSGLCSMAKLVIAMEAGMIPRNLHFETPSQHIPALKEGTLKVVTEDEPWNGGIMAINSTGFGGSNAHVVLRSNPKTEKVVSISPIPRLIGVSGRTEAAVNNFLARIEQTRQDKEFLALLDGIHETRTSRHPYKGYAVFKDEPLIEVSQTSSETRPIVFIYSGMGAQWPGMAKQLLHLDCFKASIATCAEVLKAKGIDLESILSDGSETILEDVVNSFVSITAMHIALTDVLKTVGIEPSIIIGHSLGEIGCGYADGSLTREQAILAAYSRGRAILETDLPLGTMAAVELSLEEIEGRCPPEIFPVCHNSEDSTTISGPPQPVQEFLMELQEEGIRVKKVETLGRAFHSKYIADAGPHLHRLLDEIIPDPSPRSPKWISSSIPKSEWNTPLALYSSPEYFVNNLLSPVLFREALEHVPDDAIVIEIDSNGILQSILRRSLGIEATNITLVKRGHDDDVSYLLAAIGKIFIAGAQVKMSNLYPPVPFPVSRGTPMISSMIEWDHSHEWFVPDFSMTSVSGEFNVEVDLNGESYQYLAGHNIDGRIIFPASGYLLMVWQTLAKLRNLNFEQTPVVFTNVQFHRDIIISPGKSSCILSINILEGSGRFEICESRRAVTSGMITISQDSDEESIVLNESENAINSGTIQLTSKDVYKELRLRGYDYGGVFRGITDSDNLGIAGKLAWRNNWTSFIDTMLQFHFLGKRSRELYLPNRLQRVSINPKEHFDIIEKLPQGENVPVRMYHNIDIIRSGGVELCGIRAISVPRSLSIQAPPKLERYQFIPYDNTQLSMWDFGKAETQALTVLLQIVMENIFDQFKLYISEVVKEKPVEFLLSPIIKSIIDREALMTADVTVVTEGKIDASALEANKIKYIVRDINNHLIGENLHLIVLSHVLAHNDKTMLDNAASSIKDGGFILLEEMKGHINTQALRGLEVISKQCADDRMFLLLRKPILPSEFASIIHVTEKNFTWVEPLKEIMSQVGSHTRRIYLYAESEKLNGLIGMINCLRQEPGGSDLRSVFIQDTDATKFSISAYESQLRKDLVHNVLMKKTWGCYRHIELHRSETSKVEHAYVDTLVRGDLSSLRWIEGPVGYHEATSQCPNLCYTYYATINYRDILMATEKSSPEVLSDSMSAKNHRLGSEFSGRNHSTGRRVMGIVHSDGLATSVRVDTGFLWDVPDKWSLEDAATVPVAYAMSYYALDIRGGLKSGDTILVHAGFDGVGQAAINLALHKGCVVFTTVTTREEREFLKRAFPRLRDEHIGSSRNATFEQMVMTHTNGKGVDCVLNSPKAHQLQASIKCLSDGGRFLEIAQEDHANDSPLDTGMFYKNITFHRILLDPLFRSHSPEKQRLIHLVTEGIANGTVKPLPRTVFGEDQVQQAFRFMASGDNIGKAIIKIRDEEDIKAQCMPGKTLSAIPRTYMDPRKSYVVVGGLGGFGFELADWLITRGARNVILASRSGVKTAYQFMCIDRWTTKGNTVLVSTIDVSVEEGARALLNRAIEMGPIGGIFNLALVLADAMMENQSVTTFEAVCKPKVSVTKMLDNASRLLAPQLDYFVVFSSVTSGRGNPGQSNYGLANSVLERLVESRQVDGLPGLAIQWGAIGDVGVVYESMGGFDTVIRGTAPQRISSCFRTLDVLLRQPYPVVSSMVVAEKMGISGNGSRVDLRDAVGNILGIKDFSSVSMTRTLADIGMDSLMSAEIKRTLELNYSIVLGTQEIRALTFARILELGATVKNQK